MRRLHGRKELEERFVLIIPLNSSLLVTFTCRMSNKGTNMLVFQINLGDKRNILGVRRKSFMTLIRRMMNLDPFFLAQVLSSNFALAFLVSFIHGHH